MGDKACSSLPTVSAILCTALAVKPQQRRIVMYSTLSAILFLYGVSSIQIKQHEFSRFLMRLVTGLLLYYCI